MVQKWQLIKHTGGEENEIGIDIALGIEVEMAPSVVGGGIKMGFCSHFPKITIRYNIFLLTQFQIMILKNIHE